MRSKRLILRALLAIEIAIFAATTPVHAKKLRLGVACAFTSQTVQLGTLCAELGRNVKAASFGRIRFRMSEPGALVPVSQYFDAVSKGSLDAAYTTAGFYQGKAASLALFSAVPFGPGAGEYLAWLYYGGGNELREKIYAGFGIKSMACGIIAPEASGWFRKEIKSLADLKGLKMRFFGLGARVMQKLGVETQLLSGKEIYSALERGRIDATEFSMPAIDLSKGLHQIAKHYYFPGWHQQATLFDLIINRKIWDGMSSNEQAFLQLACKANITQGLAEGEALQGRALIELRRKGVQIHRWPPEMLDAFRAAWNEVVVEITAKDPQFKEVWASLQKFRAEYKSWKHLGYLK